MICYILQFPDAGAAGRDSALTSYLPTSLPVLVFADVTVNSVTPEGFLAMANSATVDSALLADPALMLAYDETAARAGQASIIVANIPTVPYQYCHEWIQQAHRQRHFMRLFSAVAQLPSREARVYDSGVGLGRPFVSKQSWGRTRAQSGSTAPKRFASRWGAKARTAGFYSSSRRLCCETRVLRESASWLVSSIGDI
jgi:hypothetical protein